MKKFDTIMYPADMNEESFEDSQLDKNSSRAPKCRRCRNHNVLSDLRGHKHQCNFKDCVCSKCVIVTDGQRQTAVRIALYRQQKTIEPEMTHNGQLYENGMEGNAVWSAPIDDRPLENGYGKRKYHVSSDSGSTSPGSDLSSSAPGNKRLNLDSPPTIRDGACAPNLPVPHEVLSRAFPNHSPSILDLVLKGCNGNVLHAIELISQYEKLPKTNSMGPFPPLLPCTDSTAPVPNMMPPLYKLNCMNGSFRYFVPPGMLPLNPFMLGGGPPPYPFVPPGSFQGQAEGIPSSVHAERERVILSNRDITTLKIETPEDEREPRTNGVDSAASRCETCGHGKHFGDRFCTNCTESYSS